MQPLHHLLSSKPFHPRMKKKFISSLMNQRTNAPNAIGSPVDLFPSAYLRVLSNYPVFYFLNNSITLAIPKQITPRLQKQNVIPSAGKITPRENSLSASNTS